MISYFDHLGFKVSNLQVSWTCRNNLTRILEGFFGDCWISLWKTQGLIPKVLGSKHITWKTSGYQYQVISIQWLHYLHHPENLESWKTYALVALVLDTSISSWGSNLLPVSSMSFFRVIFGNLPSCHGPTCLQACLMPSVDSKKAPRSSNAKYYGKKESMDQVNIYSRLYRSFYVGNAWNIHQQNGDVFHLTAWT